MKKFKERMAEKAGFTLVELIVVIAILGILAAVAVPAYTGYVQKAKDAAVYSELSIIVTTAQSVAVEDGQVVTAIAVSNAGAITVTCEEASYDLDETKIDTYADNVTNGSIENWVALAKGTSFEKGADWARGSANADGSYTDAAWSPKS